MPLPVWLASLPYPLQDGHQATPGSRHERTALGGPVEDVAEVFSGANITLPYRLIVTRTQLFELRAWCAKYKPNVNWVLVSADIGFGMQQYEARVLRLDIPHVALDDSDGDGATEWSIPFDLEIRAKADGSYWDISEEEADVVLGGFLYIDDNILVG